MTERGVPRMFGKRLQVSGLDSATYYLRIYRQAPATFEFMDSGRWRVDTATGYRIFDTLQLAEEWAEQKVREFWRKLGERIGERR